MAPLIETGNPKYGLGDGPTSSYLTKLVIIEFTVIFSSVHD